MIVVLWVNPIDFILFRICLACNFERRKEMFCAEVVSGRGWSLSRI